jgi:L-threonylcarbamoyladenylate synthase
VSDDDVARAVATLRAGGLAIVPTDTVYGLAADGESEAAARRLYETKGRASIQPTALVLASVDELLARLPELPDPALRVVRALLPGPFTLVVPNPRRRYAWLNADRPEALGVRVPVLGRPGREVLTAIGAVVATSANLPGGPDPRRVADVPPELAAAVGAVLDGGELPGTPSTVVDVTGAEPVILREGAVTAAEALGRAADALTDR